MQLENYLEFNTEPVEHIRLKGTRIGIEHVIAYHKQFMTPEQIAYQFAYPLDLAQVYAAITYYLANKAEMEAYLKRGEERFQKIYEEYLAIPPTEAMKRIRAIKAERAMKESARLAAISEALTAIGSGT